MRHNQLYEEGKVTWWKKITEWSDLTTEEFVAHMNLGMGPLDRNTLTNTIDEVIHSWDSKEGKIIADY